MPEFNPVSLIGKTILVTGASSGIGRAIAVECSRLGAAVVCSGRSEPRLQETLGLLEGGGHAAVPADLDADEGLSTLVDALPKLHGAAMVAGINKSIPAAFLKRDEIQRILDTNLIAPMLLQAALLRQRKLQKGASLVYMASAAAVAGQPGQAVYAASKGALVSYMKVLAQELGPKGIRANCILPGMVETPLIHRGTFDEETLKADMLHYPLRRYGQPEEVAHLAAFLLSDAAAWISGASYAVDGGLTRR